MALVTVVATGSGRLRYQIQPAVVSRGSISDHQRYYKYQQALTSDCPGASQL